MCFSAAASFSSGVVLSVVGVATLRKSTAPSRVAFAAIPFIFAVQQVSEGFVWLSLTRPAFAGWQMTAAFVFLTFAHILWPVWVPFSILLMERKSKQKNQLYLLLGVGLVLASYYAFCLATCSVTPKIEGYHIQYILDYPAYFLAFSSWFYGLATLLPTFVSSIKKMWMLGFCIVLSYAVTYFFYREYIISVWCYFAALMSAIIYWILYGLHKTSLTTVFLTIKTAPVMQSSKIIKLDKK